MDAFAPAPGDLVLEIGPGRGALTGQLAGKAVELAAIELDPALAEALSEKFAESPGVRIIEGDALELLRFGLPGLAAEMGASGQRRLRVIGNLPYSIATPLVREIASHGSLICDALVMVQKEVADRILAPPGSRETGLLTILIALQADARRLFDLAPGAFRPRPQVRSTVLALRMPAAPLHPAETLRRVEALASLAFSHRRKTMLNALAGAKRETAAGGPPPAARIEALLRSAGIDPTERPERITPERWVTLAELADPQF